MVTKSLAYVLVVFTFWVIRQPKSVKAVEALTRQRALTRPSMTSGLSTTTNCGQHLRSSLERQEYNLALITSYREHYQEHHHHQAMFAGDNAKGRYLPSTLVHPQTMTYSCKMQESQS